MANEISRRNSFSSHDILTISNRKLKFAEYNGGQIYSDSLADWRSIGPLLPFMENTIHFSTARQFIRIDKSRSGTFDSALEIGLQLLDHPVEYAKRLNN